MKRQRKIVRWRHKAQQEDHTGAIPPAVRIYRRRWGSGTTWKEGAELNFRQVLRCGNTTSPTFKKIPASRARIRRWSWRIRELAEPRACRSTSAAAETYKSWILTKSLKSCTTRGGGAGIPIGGTHPFSRASCWLVSRETCSPNPPSEQISSKRSSLRSQRVQERFGEDGGV